jgi:hypothetical protein
MKFRIEAEIFVVLEVYESLEYAIKYRLKHWIMQTFKAN